MEALQKRTPSHSTLADGEVIARVTHGEKGLYEILMRRYNQTLYRAVRSYLHKEVDVEDAMQETYLKAYAKLDQFKGEAAFSTWLVRIGINEALQQLRKTRTMHVHSDPDVRMEQLSQLPDTGQMNPEQRTIQGENRRVLEQAIDKLPEGYRAVYMLREVEGMNVAEVAQCLSISEANVKVRLHRAKSMLKEAIWGQHAKVAAFEFGNTHCDRLVAAVMARI
ncbi:MAG: RNA polymerase sigma factor [Flavobacteriales bacterium]|jgi:RNA polymerase sigma-70 factor (ECF subfamily)|nr:RNA polymerase sigma factor [Flavobacteriales bacterium]MCB0757675.1 RNA polymerase sigma factor [Flavobacteriales bacterium]